MSVTEQRLRAVPRSDLEQRIEALAPWFHNIKLNGIWTAPGGAAKVAWFPDPDGNTLSISQH